MTTVHRDSEWAMEHQFSKRGYVVAAPCLIPFGRRVDADGYGGNDPCAVTFVRMQADGLSDGGQMTQMTMLAAAIDQRI